MAQSRRLGRFTQCETGYKIKNDPGPDNSSDEAKDGPRRTEPTRRNPTRRCVTMQLERVVHPGASRTGHARIGEDYQAEVPPMRTLPSTGGDNVPAEAGQPPMTATTCSHQDNREPTNLSFTNRSQHADRKRRTVGQEYNRLKSQKKPLDTTTKDECELCANELCLLESARGLLLFPDLLDSRIALRHAFNTKYDLHSATTEQLKLAIAYWNCLVPKSEGGRWVVPR